MTDEEIVKRAKEAEKRKYFGEIVHSPISKGVNSVYGIGFIEGMEEYRNSLQEEPISEELEDFAKRQADEFAEREYEVDSYDRDCLSKGYYWGCNAGAKWQKKHLWKPAEGSDLPIIDREVIALLDNGKVVFAHRPPEYWDGKDIDTGKVTRHYPKTYGDGGWNIPDAKWWLDLKLPYE